MSCTLLITMMRPPNSKIQLHLLVTIAIWPLLISAASLDAVPTLKPRTERYNIDLDPICETNTANIYKASDVESQERVIVKAFKGDDYFEWEETIYDTLDINIAKATSTPKILWRHFVKLLHKCDLSGSPAIVLELLVEVLSNTIELDHIKATESGLEVCGSAFTNLGAGAPLQPSYNYEVASQFKRYAYQLLEAVDVLHRLGIFHLDLKPSNIGLTGDNNLKLFDFGLSQTQIWNINIVTREYRAPEVSLGLLHYVQKLNQVDKVDIWSIGCVIYKIFTGNLISDMITPFSDATSTFYCNMRAGYFYTKWSFGSVTPKTYQEAEARAEEHCPEIFSPECMGILQDNKPSIFDCANMGESRPETVVTDFLQKMGEFTQNLSLKSTRLDPSLTEPGELVQLLTGLLRFDFNARITTQEALTQYRIFDTLHQNTQ